MSRQTIQFTKTADNVRLAYGVSGSGPILVKCANWLNHLEYDWESPIWKHMLEFFSAHFTLIRYDERGCGLSDWDCKNNSFEKWVDDLEQVIETNELDKFPLLGISQGAAVAIEYALRHPEKVSHLILYGGYLVGRDKRGSNEYKKQQLLLAMIESGWDDQNPAFRQVFASLFVPNGSHEHQQWFAELCRKTATAENAHRIQTICSGVDVRERLDELDIPTLVLHAKDDAMVPIEAGKYMAAEIPNAQFVQLDSANHLLLSDEPAWEHFCDEVLRFLNVPEQKVESVELTKLELLTAKEKSILALLGQGLSNNMIAEKAFLSEKTIRNHLTNIYDKLGVSTRSEAIVLTRSSIL
ncbi:MAG: alpha/beta fold hydrolase [Pseudohongiella sp.]|nr:alpha/beta fold hydrolase [Pseudohongiella sp.]